MSAKLMISGSTILSNPAKLEELFWNEAQGIEIGFLPGWEALETVVSLCHKHRAEWGVHHPLIRGKGGNDLLNPNPAVRKEAFLNLLFEIQTVKRYGGKYILVHFPFFPTDIFPYEKVSKEIAMGLEELSAISEDTGMPILIEPKIRFQEGAVNRPCINPGGIYYLWSMREELKSLAESSPRIGICLDVGDWFLAATMMNVELADLVSPILLWIRSIHLHHVRQTTTHYFWTPIHPNPERNTASRKLTEFVPALLGSTECDYVVLEHTPEFYFSDDYITEGVEWIRHLLKRQAAKKR